MKRSEMIKKIDDELRGKDAREIICVEDFADKLLTLMEQMGMAPPEYTMLPDSYNRAEGTYGFPVHEWEDEDNEN